MQGTMGLGSADKGAGWEKAGNVQQAEDGATQGGKNMVGTPLPRGMGKNGTARGMGHLGMAVRLGKGAGNVKAYRDIPQKEKGKGTVVAQAGTATNTGTGKGGVASQANK